MKATKETQEVETQEVEMLKDGARRMQEFLQEKGLEVKHSLLLEAISAGFGSRNWRTVRDKLNAPLGGKTVTLEDLGGLRWVVHGIYCDNNQRYSESYKGETALEAQIIAQVDRMLDGCQIDVSCVIDMLTGKNADEESFTFEASIIDPSRMLQRLAVAARRILGGPPQLRGIAEAEAWDSANLAIEIFEELLGPDDELLGPEDAEPSFNQRYLKGELNSFWSEQLPKPPAKANREFSYVDLRGEGWGGLTATDELQVVLNIILKNGIASLSDKEKICFYEAKAILELGAELFDYIFSSCIDES